MSIAPQPPESRIKGRECVFVLGGTDPVPVRGRAEWVTADRAYVVVPYGTARRARQNWRATAIIPDEAKPAVSHEFSMTAELLSAGTVGDPDSDREGLLLRLSDIDEARKTALGN